MEPGIYRSAQLYLCAAILGGFIAVPRTGAALPPGFCGTTNSPGPRLAPQAIRADDWTHGTKHLLYIRVRFSDDVADPNTFEQSQTDLDQASADLNRISFGQYSFDSVITPVFSLSATADSYTGQSALLQSDARRVAAAAGYRFEEYDLDVIRHNPAPGFPGGYGTIGQRGVWLQVAGPEVIVHEIGHNLGLSHANFWDTGTPSSSPKISPPFPSGTNEGREGHEFDADSLLGHDSMIGPGESIEYGDMFDVMGGGDHPTQYNASYKVQLGWLKPQHVGTVRNSGVYRLYAFDAKAVSFDNLYALRIDRALNTSGGGDHYWIQYKGGPSIYPNIGNGVQIHWNTVDPVGASSLLIDTTPASEGRQTDATLVLGRTFSDQLAQIHITPLRTGGDDSARWIDVAVQMSSPENNHPPSLQLTAPKLLAQPGEVLSFSASVTDPDGDILALNWDFGNGAVAGNETQVSSTWDREGEYIVRVEATDLHGGIAAAHVVVTIGHPATFRISGHVRDEAALPMVGFRVHNGRTFRNGNEGNHVSTLTDSDGSYDLVNLKAGSYTNAAFQFGYITERLTKAAVEIVDHNVSDSDFVTRPIPTVTVTPSSPTIFEGDPESAFIFTRHGPTADPLTVFFSTGGTAQPRSDYPDFFVRRITFPAGSSTAALRFSTFDDGISEGPETLTMTVLYPREMQREIVQDGQLVPVTFFFPGWELREDTAGSGDMLWFQTDPEFIPGPPAVILIQDATVRPSLGIASRDGGLYLTLTGSPGQTQVLEQSLDLTTWVPHSTNVLTTGVLQLPLSTATPRFFRSRAQ